MDARKRVDNYARQSRRYLKNAFKSIEAGDSDKAGEFLWGSMAEALKALALSNGIPLRSHRQIWDYAKTITKEIEDKSIYDAFVHANFLHSNFYECELEMSEVRRLADDIRIAVEKLLELIPKEETSAKE